MSDLFKRHRPKLSEDESRALWERVRAMPREAGVRRLAARPWWAALWAVPAVRFGAPALAVALVAVVWVAQQSPTPPARQRATAKQAPSPPASSRAPATAVGGESESRGDEPGGPAAVDRARPAPAPAPAARRELAAPPRDADEPSTKVTVLRGERQASGTADDRLAAGKEDRKDEAGAFAKAPAAANEAAPSPGPAATSGPPATAQEGVRVTSGRSVQPGPTAAEGKAAAPAPAPAGSSAGSAEVQAPQYGKLKDSFWRENPRVGTIRPAVPEPDDAAARRQSLVAGGRFTAEILEDVVRPGTTGPYDRLISGPLTGRKARVRRDASGRWSVAEDPESLRGVLVPPRSVEYRTGLALELVWAVAAGDAGAVGRVRAAAAAAREAAAGDAGLDALLGWCEAARQAIGSK